MGLLSDRLIWGKPRNGGKDLFPVGPGQIEMEIEEEEGMMRDFSDLEINMSMN